MRFESLTFRNFMRFGPKETTLKLADRGLVLIEGENRDDQTAENNGAGKSSIQEALVWALFGQTIRGLSSDEVVNEDAGQDCMVGLVFSDDKGREYRIERYRKDKKQKNRLRLFSGKAELTKSDSSKTQDRIEEILGMDFTAFVNSVVFGQGVMKHFADMTDKEQKAIMDKMVGVEAISAAHKAARDRVKEIENEIAAVKMGGAEDDTEEAKRALQEAKEAEEGWAEAHDSKVAKLRKRYMDLKSGSDADALHRQLAALQARFKAAKASYDGAKAKEDAARTALAVADQKYEEASAKLQRMRQKAGRCDACGSVVDDAHVNQHRKQLSGLKQAALTDANQKRAKHKSAKEAAAELRRTADVLEGEIEEAREALTDAKTRAAECKAAKVAYESAKAESNPHLSAVSKAKAALAKAERALKAEEAQVKTLRSKLRYAQFAQTMFSDKGGDGLPPLKGLLLDSVVPFLNKKAAHYAKFLTDGNIRIEFDTQSKLKSGEVRDQFEVRAINRYGSSVYRGNSGGEKRKIDVCIALALQALGASRNRSQVNLAFYDEIFESLDETAQETVMELLLEEKKHRDSVFVITHLAGLKSYFPRKVRVVKEGGVSSIQ